MFKKEKMKKKYIFLLAGIIFLTLFAIVLVSATVPAIHFINQYPKQYCEHMGYIYEPGNHTIGNCIFPDNNSCEVRDFFGDSCGQEYKKEFPCRQEGEAVIIQFEECCEGLVPLDLAYSGIFHPLTIGPPSCIKEPNFFAKYLKYSLTFWLIVLVVFIVVLILIIKHFLKKRKRNEH